MKDPREPDPYPWRYDSLYRPEEEMIFLFEEAPEGSFSELADKILPPPKTPESDTDKED